MKKSIKSAVCLFLCIILCSCSKLPTVKDNGVLRVMSNAEISAAANKISTSENDSEHRETPTLDVEDDTSTQNNETTSDMTTDGTDENTSDMTTDGTDENTTTVQENTTTTHDSQNTPENNNQPSSAQKVSLGHINKTISCNNGDIVIDADAYGIKSQNVTMYDYTYNSYSSKTALAMLEDMVGAATAQTFKPVYDSWVGGAEDGMYLSNNGETGYRLSSGYICDVNNPYLGMNDGVKAPGCLLDINEDQKLADAYVAKYVTNEYQLVNREIYNQEYAGNGYTKTGYYEYIYQEYVDGISIYDVGRQAEKKVTVSMIDNMVTGINIANYNLTSKGTYKYISVDEAVSKIEQNINTYGDAYVPGPVNRIELQYFVPMDLNTGMTVNELVPAWIFYGGPYVICVNAVTGEVLVY